MITSDFLKTIIPHIDLTCLDDSATAADITALCQAAQTPYGSVASVCIYPHFLELCQQQLAGTSIKCCTVINFPHGKLSIQDTLREVDYALASNADELDIVVPYLSFIQAKTSGMLQFLQRVTPYVKQSGCVLKYILETGMITDPSYLQALSELVAAAKPDFLKTSTGKVPEGATIDKTITMMKTALPLHPHAGLKVSGGIRTVDSAYRFYQLAKSLLPHLDTDHFRIGASSLLKEIIQQLHEKSMIQTNN